MLPQDLSLASFSSSVICSLLRSLVVDVPLVRVPVKHWLHLGRGSVRVGAVSAFPLRRLVREASCKRTRRSFPRLAGGVAESG